ncbi:hypothetical protein EMIT0P43_20290 [Pseudomonas jessenii]|jgi:hypothetical protein
MERFEINPRLMSEYRKLTYIVDFYRQNVRSSESRLLRQFFSAANYTTKNPQINAIQALLLAK